MDDALAFEAVELLGGSNPRMVAEGEPLKSGQLADVWEIDIPDDGLPAQQP
ncbi:MAG: hypothetical protein ACRDP6_47230 [Actinoallomurus sp.]